MTTEIVLGSLFGDEGKGAATQWLCQKAISSGRRPLVIRYTGGPQAAHTVELCISGRRVEHIFSSFGSGTLMGAPTLYAHTALVDPICLINEYSVLASKGVSPKINISKAMIITPYDVAANRCNKETLSHGTCGKGVYEAWLRSRKARFSINDDPGRILDTASRYHGFCRDRQADDMFAECMAKARSIQEDISTSDFDTEIYESTQGLLLDASLGFLPHVTATDTGLQYFGSKHLDGASILLTMRSYLTRHGNGYTPRAVPGYNLCDESETNVENQYQGSFKTGIFDFDLLSEAFSRHRLRQHRQSRFSIAISHLDTLLRNGRFVYISQGKTSEIAVTSPSDYARVAEIYAKSISLPIEQIYGSAAPGQYKPIAANSAR